jgi:mycofactocin precursor
MNEERTGVAVADPGAARSNATGPVAGADHTELDDAAEEVLVDEVLVDEVSIDGMCGVY